MFVIKKEKGGIFSLPAAELSLGAARCLKSRLAQDILGRLAEHGPSYAAAIARELRVHEQKVYYHLRNLERAGVLSVSREGSQEEKAYKYYALRKPAFFFALRPFERTTRIAQPRGESTYLDPFIRDGQLDALIIVGSPDPHGPQKTRSRDSSYAIDLGLFLGTFLTYVPDAKVRLDVEVRPADLKRNLIVIGGPLVNAVSERLNPHLPVFFEREAKFAIRSTLSGKVYPEDECGLVCSVENPFARGKRVLLVAGKRSAGTRAAILAFLRHFKHLPKGNLHDREVHARVVEGIDRDSDGIIDDAEFRE